MIEVWSEGYDLNGVSDDAMLLHSSETAQTFEEALLEYKESIHNIRGLNIESQTLFGVKLFQLPPVG